MIFFFILAKLNCVYIHTAGIYTTEYECEIPNLQVHICEKVIGEEGPLRKEKQGGETPNSKLEATFKVYMLELEFKDTYPEGSSPNGNFFRMFCIRLILTTFLDESPLL